VCTVVIIYSYSHVLRGCLIPIINTTLIRFKYSRLSKLFLSYSYPKTQPLGLNLPRATKLTGSQWSHLSCCPKITPFHSVTTLRKILQTVITRYVNTNEPGHQCLEILPKEVPQVRCGLTDVFPTAKCDRLRVQHSSRVHIEIVSMCDQTYSVWSQKWIKDRIFVKCKSNSQ